MVHLLMAKLDGLLVWIYHYTKITQILPWLITQVVAEEFSPGRSHGTAKGILNAWELPGHRWDAKVLVPAVQTPRGEAMASEGLVNVNGASTQRGV